MYKWSEVYAYFGIDENGVFRQEITVNRTNIHIFPDYARLEGANDIGSYDIDIFVMKKNSVPIKIGRQQHFPCKSARIR